MPKQTVQDLFNRTEARQRMAEEQAEDEVYDGSWRDPMAPPAPEDCDEDGTYHPGPSFAEQFTAFRPSQKSRAAYPEVEDTRGSAWRIAAAITPRQAEEPAPEPEQPPTRGVAELIEAYEEADELYDERELYGGSGDMSPTEWRTAWGRR
jgi:hypothetical protein